MALLAGFLLYPAILIARFNKDLVRVSTVQIDIGDQFIDLGIDIAVRRETPFHKLLDSISYTVSFDTFQFVKGALRLDSVRSGTEFDSIVLPARLDFKKLRHAIKTLQGKDSVDLSINFVAHYWWPIIDRVDVPLNIIRRMPPPNPPEVKLLNVDVEKFSFNEPIVDITLQLINENNFSLTLKDLHLHMNFEELFRAEIHHPKEINILAKDTTIINVTANVYELKAIKTVWQLMVKRIEISYNMHIKAKYIDQKGEADPIDITITNSGSVQTKSKKQKREEAGLTKKDVRQERREERREERQAD